jgi:uncharacterized membrane protein
MDTGRDKVAGAALFVAAYNDETTAGQVLEAIEEATRQGALDYGDVAVIRQDAGGQVHIRETGDLTAGTGAGAGALVGGLIGLLGGPVGVAIGAGVGGAIGGVVAGRDTGFDDDSLKELGVALKPGSSALVFISSDDLLDAVRDQVSKGDILATVKTLGQDISAALAAGTDVAYGLMVTDEGLVATQVTAQDEMAEVLGLVEKGNASRDAEG